MIKYVSEHTHVNLDSGNWMDETLQIFYWLVKRLVETSKTVATHEKDLFMVRPLGSSGSGAVIGAVRR